MTSSPAQDPGRGGPAGRRASAGSGAALTPEELEARLRGPGELTEADLDALDAWYRLCDDPDDFDPACEDPGDDPGPGRPGGAAQPAVPDIITAWLGLTDNPGQISGTGAGGPADAATCRQLADILARAPKTRWCITLTDPAGRAVAHGCARAGPGPPGTGKHAWLASVKITTIETGTCSHADQSAGYRPAPKLCHKVKIRSPRCGFPGCRRPAWRCDDDHTIPYHNGGRTCECNMHPLCRYHHQAKQTPGWHLEQPEPGVLIWTTPSGRTYTVRPEPYPI
jgi:hypothetical protein